MALQETTLRNPFPGLRPFNTEESLLFFGRDGLSDTLLEKLRATRFVAVVGTSGSGKSSLVKAGLLPALRGGFMTDAGSSWRVALFRPINNPIGNLAKALLESGMSPTAAAGESSKPLALIEETLRRTSLGLIEVVRRATFSGDENLLVVVDQFEELYRSEPSSEVEHPKDEAAAFVKLLLAATQQAEIPIYVILTMRSDYLGESAHFWGLPEAINRGQFLIPRMDDDERREAIEGPVRVRGAKISWPLVNRLLNDTGDDPTQLPILQHALMRTWSYWEKNSTNSNPLEITDYDNKEVGGMDRALSLHADEAYTELTDLQQAIAEKIFKRLTEKGNDAREGRLPATVAELTEITGARLADVLAVIEVFRKKERSFLMPPVPNLLTPDTLIDTSHESLISGWSRLSAWVDREAESAKTYGRLVDDAHRYPKFTPLLTNPELETTLLWLQEEKPTEIWARRYQTEFGKALDGANPPHRPAWADRDSTEFGIAMKYLDLSRVAHQRAEDLKESKRRRSVVTLGVAAALFLSLSIVSFGFYVSAARAKSRAEASQHQALSDKQAAVEARQEADALAETARSLTIEANLQRTRAVDALNAADTQRLKAEASAQAAQAAKRGFELQAKRGNLLELGLFAAVSGEVKTAIARLEDVGRITDISKKAIYEVLIGDVILKSEFDFDNGADSENALNHYKQALSLSQSGKAKLDPSVFVRIGDNIIASDLDDGEAIPYFKYAIGMMGAEKDRRSKRDTLIKLAALEDLTAARNHYEEALSLSKDDAATTIQIYINLGKTYSAGKNPKEAEAAYRNALKFARSSGDAVTEGNALAKIGDIYLDKDQDREQRAAALKLYSEAHEAYRVDSTKSPTMEALLGDARVLELLAQYLRQSDAQAAVKYYQLELNRYQATLRARGNDPERDRMQKQRARVMISQLDDKIEALKPLIISQILFNTIQEKDLASAINQYPQFEEESGE